MSFTDARAFWDSRFDTPDYIFGTEPNRFLASQAGLIKPGTRVLDVACGEGRNAVWLARQGARVTAVDVSPLGLEKARRLAAEAGVEVDFRLADLRDWAWEPGAYDLVACVFIQFADPEERGRMFGGILETLKPGGHLVLQGYTPKQLDYKTGGPPSAAHLYTADLLREALAGLEFLHLAEHESWMEEGSKHKGMSALIDLVARKPVGE